MSMAPEPLDAAAFWMVVLPEVAALVTAEPAPVLMVLVAV